MSEPESSSPIFTAAATGTKRSRSRSRSPSASPAREEEEDDVALQPSPQKKPRTELVAEPEPEPEAQPDADADAGADADAAPSLLHTVVFGLQNNEAYTLTASRPETLVEVTSAIEQIRALSPESAARTVPFFLGSLAAARNPSENRPYYFGPSDVFFLIGSLMESLNVVLDVDPKGSIQLEPAQAQAQAHDSSDDDTQDRNGPM